MVAAVARAEPPNVLIIMADDCTFNDLPMYGGQNALTPNLEQLASEGLVFNRAYLTAAMCQPCRAELYTGPVSDEQRMRLESFGQLARNQEHAASPGSTRLSSRAWRVRFTCCPKEAFPFEPVAGFDRSCVREPTQTHDLSGVTEFMGRECRSSRFAWWSRWSIHTFPG